MLVLSRRPEEQILFPEIGVTIEVLRIRGNLVRLGIQAPEQIRVVRKEVCEASSQQSPQRSQTWTFTRKQYHEFCNQLNCLKLAFALHQKQLHAGLEEQAAGTLTSIERLVHELERKFVDRPVEVEPPAQQETVGKSCSMLIVEDNQNERELLAGLMRMNGYEIATAQDGMEAIEYLDSHKRPDIMLLDMMMPRCGGPETINAVRHNPRFDGLTVCALSASSPEQFGIPRGPQGIDRWYPKPLNVEQLVREIGSFAHKSTTA